MLPTVRVRKHERGLWFRYGEFVRIVGPGTYRLWSRTWSPVRNSLEVVDTLETRFDHPQLDQILEDPRARQAFLVVDLDDGERALIWKDGRLEAIVGPGRHAFWPQPFQVRAEIFRIDELWLRHPKIATVVAHQDSAKWLSGFEVKPYETSLLYRDGELVDNLGAGRHYYWKGAAVIDRRTVDLRERTADVAGQEIMTRDKVTLRVNLVVTHQVIDAARSVSAVADADQALYREAQLALRAAIGTRNLDVILSDKEVVGGEVREALTRRVSELGMAVRSVGLRDIILPGDMKAILNQVIVAEKQAQANLIRRREETAAARSQANTAKLLAENPVLARMKELEVLQEILAGTQAAFVFGQGDVSEQVRSLIGARKPQ